VRPYLIVSGDFVRTGGMDAANYWMARYLAERGHEVHLVAHRIAADLARHANVRFHRVPKPARSALLGEPLMDRAGRHWAASIGSRGGCVISNGGNCIWTGFNWVHYVHAAYEPAAGRGFGRRIKERIGHRMFLSKEHRALSAAKLIIANSLRTREDLIANGIAQADRIQTVYYGTDPNFFRPRSLDERAEARRTLGLSNNRPAMLFIGAVSDERKGFASLLEAWRRLCAAPSWDVDLAVVGSELGSAEWRRAATGLPVHFLGFREDIATVLGACDALVSPARYEAYGLAAHEALCSEVPALVPANAGVAERYPAALHGLLLRDARDVTELCERLLHWRSHMDRYRSAMPDFSRELRSRTWSHACAEMTAVMEAAG
jgi:glycosyltransferase involved in cell wall biosynthesis